MAPPDLQPTDMQRTSTFTALAFALAASVSLARPAAAQFGTNLVVNGGAEAGAGGNGNTVVAVPGWTTTGRFTVVRYDAGNGFPAAASPGSPTRGANFFSGGPSAFNASASQTIALGGFDGLGALIDAGAVEFTLAGWLGGWDRQDDNAVLRAQFLGDDAGVLGSASIGPVLGYDRGLVTGMLFRSVAGALPVGTRSVALTLTMTVPNQGAGDYNDGYADDLSFTLARPAAPATTVPEPATVALLGGGLTLLGVVARRRRRVTA